MNITKKIINKRIKKIFIGSLMVICVIGVVGCDTSSTNNDETVTIVLEKDETEEKEFDFNQIIESTDKIKIKQDIFNFNKVYTISVDDEDIGEINGEFINITGDVFTLTDKYNKEIASEKQIKRWGIKLNRLAEVYDSNGSVSGYIGEEVINDLFKVGRIMHFYDINQNEIGTCEQKVFNLLDEYIVYDSEGNEDYRIKEKFSIMEPEYEIEVKNEESIIKETDVIFVTSIIDAIKSSESSED